MEEGRAKRAVQANGRGGAKVKSALAELAELRKTGGKRADKFECKEEEDVYDLVDDDAYAAIVQKRREEGGEFTTRFVDRRSPGCSCVGVGRKGGWLQEEPHALIS
jgi:hypothetical protein